MLYALKRILPVSLQNTLRTPYHYLLQWGAMLINGFPASHMIVVGVTGTKGKSTVADMLYAILAVEHKTALASTIRFKTPASEEKNLFKMTMQGRGFIQRFLGRARRDGATHAVVEITSEGVLQYRHLFLALDALIVTNIQKEHIESHGSFENYVAAKREIVTELERSPKPRRALIVHTDVPDTASFLGAAVTDIIPFSMNNIGDVRADDGSVSFLYKDVRFTVPLAGTFNATNALAAIKAAEWLHIPLVTAQKALAKMQTVHGRVEHVSVGEKQRFIAIVDYAHTPDSLRAVYSAFPNRKKICVLGNTGGGRDQWKRPEMGAIADSECDTVILTNEDPYDEDPVAIVNQMAAGMKRKPKIIMDRREAIRAAIRGALPGDVVIVSGKGTDPYIMGPKGHKTPWSDSLVVHEELEKLLQTRD